VDLYLDATPYSYAWAVASNMVYDANGDGIDEGLTWIGSTNVRGATAWNFGPVGDVSMAAGTETAEPVVDPSWSSRGYVVTNGVEVRHWDLTNGLYFITP